MRSEIPNQTICERFRNQEAVGAVIRQAVLGAVRRHMLLGESVAVADESGEGVRILTPDEIRRALRAA